MFAFSSSLFWYKFIFMTGLILAEILATYTLHKKKHFVMRLIATLCILFFVTFFYPIGDFSYTSFYISLMFLVFFGLTLIGLKFLYDESWENILFCGVLSYTVQHISYSTYTIFDVSFGFSTFGFYEPDFNVDESKLNVFGFLVYFLSYALIYWFIWAFVEINIRRQKNLVIKHKYMLFLVLMDVLVDVFINAIVVYTVDAFTPKIIQVCLYLFNILSCILTISIQFAFLQEKSIENQLSTIKTLWEKDKKNYELSKANIDIINVKCHDLKRQIATLKSNPGLIDETGLDEIENAIDIYDAKIKTGNEALDVVLTEKSLICEKEGIYFLTLMEAKDIAFMSSYHLYTLFENAVQNAIEATSKIENKSKRVIRLKVSSQKGLLLIHLENSKNEGKLEIKDNFPVTDKKDKAHHGFGMQSISMVVSHYNGFMNTSIEDNLFTLDIAIPLHQK